MYEKIYVVLKKIAAKRNIIVIDDKVFPDGAKNLKACMMREDDLIVIKINPRFDVSQKAFSLGHELGHYVNNHLYNYSHEDISYYDIEEEKMCDHFSKKLLSYIGYKIKTGGQNTWPDKL